MTTGEINFFTSIAVQLPLLFLFVWYNDRMLRRFDARQDKRDEVFVSSIKSVSDALEKHDNRVDERIDRVRENGQPTRRAADRK